MLCFFSCHPVLSTNYAPGPLTPFSFNSHHNLGSRPHCPSMFYRVRTGSRLSNNNPKAIQQIKEGSISCFTRIFKFNFIPRPDMETLLHTRYRNTCQPREYKSMVGPGTTQSECFWGSHPAADTNLTGNTRLIKGFDNGL